MDAVTRALRNAALRIVIVEQDYRYQVGTGGSAVPTTGTMRFSNRPYTDSENPTVKYVDALLRAPVLDRSLTLDGDGMLQGIASASVSEGVYDNTNGSVGYLLDLPIDGSETRVFVGTVDQSGVQPPFSQFTHLFSCLAVKAVSDRPGDLITVSHATTLDILLGRRMIGGTVTVGGTGANADQFRPLNFGYVHQVAPILIESSPNFKYAHSDTGTNTAAVVVRSNGIVLTEGVDWNDNGDGTFTLTGDPHEEEVTCDVLATRSGGTAIGYRVSDAVATLIGDRAGLTALGKYAGPQYASLVTESLNDYPVGVPIPEQTNAADVLTSLMNTFNGFAATDRDGSVYISRMRPDALTTVIADSGGAITVAGELTEDDIEEGTIALDRATPGASAFQAIINANVTQQSQFASTLTADEKDLLKRPGKIIAAFYGEDPGTTSYFGSSAPYLGGAPELYHLSMSPTPQLISTLISGPSDTAIPDTSSSPADTWDMATYGAAFVSVHRSQRLPQVDYHTWPVGIDHYAHEIGHILNQKHRKFGLSGGVLGQIYRVAIDPMGGVTLGLTRRRFAGTSGPPPSYELREDGGYELREDGGRELRE